VIEHQEFISEKQTAVTGLENDLLPYQAGHLAPSPNPFSHYTLFEFIAPKDIKVSLNIFSIQGILLFTSKSTGTSDGIYRIEWDGTDGKGLKQPPGIYLYDLKLGETQHTGKIIITR
jgi:hypothetical protein